MVTIGNKYNLFDPQTGNLDRRVFTDQAIYDEEMDKIFGRSWLMVAHESLVPKKNDFFLSYMGQDPVIVTRDDQMKIHVLLNMCRHRGNRVTRADDGNAKRFMCTYHGWTFENDGRLTHIPGEQEAYYGAIDKSEMGLVEARVETYAGIVFACWDKDAPNLEAWLGDARWYLDTEFNRNDAGMIALGPQKWMEPCNWKTAVDNCSDNYHVPITHYSSMHARHEISGDPMFTMEGQLAHPNPFKHLTANGHAMTFSEVAEGEDPLTFTRFLRARGKNGEVLNRQLDDFFRDKQPEVDRRLGAYRGKRVRILNHSVFPNHVLGFRLALPRGPLQTEFWHFYVIEADLPKDVMNAVIAASANNNGASGIFEQDDMDNWGQVTQSGLSAVGRRIPQALSMGVGHGGTSEQWAGSFSERYISEHNQRAFYQRWQEFMNANSWSDIHIDPITVNFEGTATMRS